MNRFTVNYRLHRAVIVLICCGLLVVLMQGTGWLVSYCMQQYRLNQLTTLVHSQARQLSYLLSPHLQADVPDNQRITRVLTVLTSDRHIPDASVYNKTGELLAHSGARVSVSRRLALTGVSAASLFSRQIVQGIDGSNGMVGFLRLTLDTRPDTTEQRLLGYLVNLLRLFIVLALFIGVVLARTLRQTTEPAGGQGRAGSEAGSTDEADNKDEGDNKDEADSTAAVNSKDNSENNNALDNNSQVNSNNSPQHNNKIPDEDTAVQRGGEA